MKTDDWNKIEREFVEWDNSTHSNASQRQILDWFSERIVSANPSKERQIIQKQDELIEGVNRINEFLHKAIEHGRGDVAEWEETYDIKLNKIKVAESGLSALKSELKDEEQPITVTDEMISAKLDSMNFETSKEREDAYDAIQWALSLKQKAQPGGEWDNLEDFNTPLDKPLEL